MVPRFSELVSAETLVVAKDTRLANAKTNFSSTPGISKINTLEIERLCLKAQGYRESKRIGQVSLATLSRWIKDCIHRAYKSIYREYRHIYLGGNICSF